MAKSAVQESVAEHHVVEAQLLGAHGGVERGGSVMAGRFWNTSRIDGRSLS